MEYRQIGRTGLQAGVVGLGCEHLDGKPYAVVEETIHAALDNGINLMDLFMPGEEVRSNIGRALAGRRDRMMIQGHICSVDLNQQYDISRDPAVCRRYFETLLRCLRTDYIDFGMLFFVDSAADYSAAFESDILEYAQDLTRRGVIRAIGASSHNPVTARRIVESGAVDLLMFSINPAFDMMPPDSELEKMIGAPGELMTGMNPVRAELYRLCEQRGVGITVMKSLGAGKLISPEHTPFCKPLTIAQCIHYALTRPAVVSALVGCCSAAQVREAVGYLELPDAERDYAPIVGSRRNDFKGNCVYCNHCRPCPAGIDIAAVNKYLDIAKLEESTIPPSIAQHYRALEHTASECIGCGSCEKRCPFDVPVIENMQLAARLFGC